MEKRNKDIIDALDAFILIGKITVLGGRLDNSKSDDEMLAKYKKAMETLHAISAKMKITINQLAQTVMDTVKKS